MNGMIEYLPKIPNSMKNVPPIQRIPTALILLSAITDFSQNGTSFQKFATSESMLSPEMLSWYYKIANFSTDEISMKSDPLSLIQFSEMSLWPSILFQIGGAEILQSDSRSFWELFTNWNSTATSDVFLQTFPEMQHCHAQYYNFVPESVNAIEKIAEFITKKKF